MLAVLLFHLLQLQSISHNSVAPAKKATAIRQNDVNGGYLGSKACVQCHAAIFNSYTQTEMGRSMTPVTPTLLANLATPKTIFNARLNRYFGVFVREGQLFQSEWEIDADGKDVFRETERVEWVIGAGQNAMGGIIRRGNGLYEAPLTFYEKSQTWAMSPGYEEVDRGFDRPIEEECIACHSARSNPIRGAVGRYKDPPFEELALGCETCHGPGETHVRNMKGGASKTNDTNPSIVNPAKLPPWLANNICMSCHQNGDARVLQPGRTIQDFRPGQPLDDTLAILMSPPTRESPPNSDHVQHYFSMTLSKCYRESSEKLSCITCHNPHIQPSDQETPAYYKSKCLRCHTPSSCTAPLLTRQQTAPQDDCIACHMPKRDISGIPHASLTNHRIVAAPEEDFPEVTFELTTPAVPDLVHLDAIPDKQATAPPLITLLQAYGQLGVEHRDYLKRYFEIADQLAPTEPNNIYVLEALASRSLQENTPEGNSAAMDYLHRAIAQGSPSAWDYEQLGTKLLIAQKFLEAEGCLRKGIQAAPYDANLYILIAEGYVADNRTTEATAVLQRALQIFPQIDLLRDFLNEIKHSGGHPGGNRPSP